jgi:hypothetical protein
LDAPFRLVLVLVVRLGLLFIDSAVAKDVSDLRTNLGLGIVTE